MRFANKFEFDPQEDLLGKGPQSEVYKAEDVTLGGRPVALKILRPQMEIDPEADKRFAREAKHTSTLAHKNIATIYEYGEDSGRAYIAMEYLEGRTLDKIIKEQALGTEECLRIALQLTLALSHVHRNRLIHRDLKPANVMVMHDGAVKLLDFGIARASGEATITQHGMLVGTVLYMSPEQVRGDDLGPRSDIFSLGAVLYHVLSQELPFPGSSFPEVCMSILDGTPAPLSQVRAGLPEAMESFVMRCLEHDPADRYPNAEVARGVLLGIADSRRTGSGASRKSALGGSLALPPIGIRGDHPDIQGLAASLRKDLSSELTRSTSIEIELLPSASIPEGARADFVLRGSLKLEDHHGALELALDQCRGGDCEITREIWHHRIEHGIERPSDQDDDQYQWELQDQLVRSAVRAIRKKLGELSLKPAEQVTTRKPDEARELALRAHAVLHRGMTKHLLASITLFRRAIEADPYCALAYAGVAEALVRKYLYWDGDESFLEEARSNARRALSIDPNCAEAHTSLGFGYHLTGHQIEAEREYRLAIQLDTSEWLAHRLLGALFSRKANLKEASPLLLRGIALKPEYISTYDHLYNVLLRLGSDRYQEAIEFADKGIAAARRRLQEAGDDQDTRLHLAMLLARMGLTDEALEVLAEARDFGPKDGFTSFHVAMVHAILGNLMEAIEALTAAQGRGYYIKCEQGATEFDVLRGLAEFQSLID